MVEGIIIGFMLFMLIGWPMLTYLGDALRYAWWSVKGGRK